jgi:hypothetical protein
MSANARFAPHSAASRNIVFNSSSVILRTEIIDEVMVHPLEVFRCPLQATLGRLGSLC